MLEFEVIHQTINRVDNFSPATDSVDYLKAKFTFLTDDWTGKAKRAIFRLGTEKYEAAVDSDGTCLIPYEVLICEDESRLQIAGVNKIFVSVYGTQDTIRIPTNESRVDLNISGYGELQATGEVTPDVYAQYVAQMEAKLADTLDAVKADNKATAQEIEADMDALKETFDKDVAALNENMKTVNETAALYRNEFANALKGNAIGNTVRVDDVSPLEHTAKAIIRSKNLLPNIAAGTTVTMNGGTFAVGDDGGITVGGTPTDISYIQLHNGAPFVTGEKMTVSLQGNTQNILIQILVFDDVNAVGGEEVGVFTIYDSQTIDMSTFPKVGRLEIYFKRINSNVEMSGTGYVQIERGEVMTEYTKYVKPSTVTVRRFGKNLVPALNAGSVTESNGVTFEPRADGGIDVSGIPTAISRLAIYGGVPLVKSGMITLKLMGSYTNLVPDFQISDKDGNLLKHVQSGTGITLNLDNFPNMAGWNIAIKRAENEVEVKGTVYVQIEVGSVTTAYEKGVYAIYTPDTTGAVDIVSVSPTMTVASDTAGALVDLEYNQDINSLSDMFNEILENIINGGA